VHAACTAPRARAVHLHQHPAPATTPANEAPPRPRDTQVLVEENLAERADYLGQRLRARLAAIDSPRIRAVRGRGLLNALQVHEHDGVTAWDVCIALRDAGLLTKPTQGDVIRLAPPLVLTEEQLDEAAAIIEKVLLSFDHAD